MQATSSSFTTVEVLNGYAILRLVGTRGGFTCYTVGQGGKSFQTLKAARTFAKRIAAKAQQAAPEPVKVVQPSALPELASIVAAHKAPASAYQIVQSIPGRGMVATTPTDIYAWASINDREVYHVARVSHLRPELQLAPRIQGLVGPMWGGLNDAGQPVIRYEDHASNDTLSR